MTKSKKNRDEGEIVRLRTRLFLVASLTAKEGLEHLAAALTAGDVASVLIAEPAVEGKAFAALARPFVELVQKRDVAVILRGDARLVQRFGADGFHSDGDITALEEVIAALSPGLIVGAANLPTRHAAMEAGEAGADYVFFGHPDNPQASDRDMLLERAEWWQSLFVAPCVICAPDLASVGGLARAGADFIALGPRIWRSGDDVRAAQSAIDAAFAG